jgi:hypothetical protein
MTEQVIDNRKASINPRLVPIRPNPPAQSRPITLFRQVNSGVDDP